MTKTLSKKFETLRNEATETIKLVKEAFPDFSQLKNRLDDNINSLIKELEEDPSIEKIFIGMYVLCNFHNYRIYLK